MLAASLCDGAPGRPGISDFSLALSCIVLLLDLQRSHGFVMHDVCW